MPAQMTIQTKVNDEIHDCVQPETSSMVQVSSSDPQCAPRGINLHMPQPNGSRSPSSLSGNSPTNNKSFESIEIDQDHIRGRSGEEDEESDYYSNGNNHHQQQLKEGQDDQTASNENLLGTAFCTFMTFATVQTIVAYFAESEAMLGDSAAMIVDALTYLFNWYAERKKAQFETSKWTEAILISLPADEDPDTRQRILVRIKRKKILQLELIPPVISVSTLLVVTATVLNESIRVLILDVHRSVADQGNPNIHIMMYFSIANLGLDLVNVANFAKAKHLFGYETSEYHPPQGHEALQDTSNGDHHGHNTKQANGNGVYHSPSKAPPSHHHHHSSNGHYDGEEDEEDQDHTANLNMCSAYSHVFADTLRSIAVLVAACISELVREVTPEEADAAAAVVVSALIMLSLIPLVNGLVQSFRELRLIWAEEKQDELFL